TARTETGVVDTREVVRGGVGDIVAIVVGRVLRAGWPRIGAAVARSAVGRWAHAACPPAARAARSAGAGHSTGAASAASSRGSTHSAGSGGSTHSAGSGGSTHSALIAHPTGAPGARRASRCRAADDALATEAQAGPDNLVDVRRQPECPLGRFGDLVAAQGAGKRAAHRDVVPEVRGDADASDRE